jgi:hypothetical protein
MLHVLASTAWSNLLFVVIALQLADPAHLDPARTIVILQTRFIAPIVVVTVVTGIILLVGRMRLAQQHWLIAKSLVVIILLFFGSTLTLFHEPTLMTRVITLVLLLLVISISTVKPGGRLRSRARATARHAVTH